MLNDQNFRIQTLHFELEVLFVDFKFDCCKILRLTFLVFGKQPGTRWIKRMAMGKPSITQVELVEGREIMGKQSSWLVTLKGIDTPEKVELYVLTGYSLV